MDDWEGTVDIEKTCGPEITPPKLAPGLDIMDATDGGLFTFIKHMAEGQGMAEGNYYGICDKDGNIILEPTYFPNSTQNLHSSYMSGETYDDCIVLTHKLTVTWDCIDDVYDGTTGKLLFSVYNTDYGSPTMNITKYGQGLFRYFTGNGDAQRFGYMKPDGTKVIADVFEGAEPFSNGYAWVKTGGLWGIIKLPTT